MRIINAKMQCTILGRAFCISSPRNFCSGFMPWLSRFPLINQGSNWQGIVGSNFDHPSSSVRSIVTSLAYSSCWCCWKTRSMQLILHNANPANGSSRLSSIKTLILCDNVKCKMWWYEEHFECIMKLLEEFVEFLSAYVRHTDKHKIKTSRANERIEDEGYGMNNEWQTARPYQSSKGSVQ